MEKIYLNGKEYQIGKLLVEDTKILQKAKMKYKMDDTDYSYYFIWHVIDKFNPGVFKDQKEFEKSGIEGFGNLQIRMGKLTGYDQYFKSGIGKK